MGFEGGERQPCVHSTVGDNSRHRGEAKEKRHSTLWDPKIFEQRKVMNVMGYEEREIAEVGHGGL